MKKTKGDWAYIIVSIVIAISIWSYQIRKAIRCADAGGTFYSRSYVCIIKPIEANP